MVDTKADADINEPEFSPKFDSFKLVKCVDDARVDYDNILATDKLPKDFPENACHEPLKKTSHHGVPIARWRE